MDLIAGDTYEVYITKYALSRGIQKRMCRWAAYTTTGMMCDILDSGVYFHGENKDWHHTYEGAKERAETMVAKKISSLKRRIRDWRVYD